MMPRPLNDDELLRDMQRIARVLRGRARRGICDGYIDSPVTKNYMVMCTRLHQPTRASIIFTRDVGMHTSGWMKNPDYERCLHLSLCPIPSQIIIPNGREIDRKTEKMWLDTFFPKDDRRFLWFETAKSEDGRRRGVKHWRLFCDEHWQPIIPRGEPYSTELTEMGFRSASQVFEEDGVLVQSTLDVS
jgi:hypothetical protein